MIRFPPSSRRRSTQTFWCCCRTSTGFTTATHKNPDAKLIHTVKRIDEHILALGGGSGSELGTGGMATKLTAAVTATEAGCEMVIANGAKLKQLYDIVDGGHVGTRFLRKQAEA